jgi:flagellar basal-body rod protein FlgB
MSDNSINKSLPKGIGVVRTSVTGKLFDNALDIMGKSLNLRLARHSLSATNLANQNTPGYRVKDIKFEKIMSEAIAGREGKLDMTARDRNHMPSRDLDFAYQAAQKNVKFGIYGQDAKGQDVIDIDQEMNKLAKNNLIYNATVQMLAKEFEILKYSISEGGS